MHASRQKAFCRGANYSNRSVFSFQCSVFSLWGEPEMLTGLSGNEIYCLAQKGWAPGNIVVGNSVYSLGFLGGLTSGFRTLAGGEVENITTLISDGRHAAIKRLEEEAQQEGAHGLTG